MDEPAPAGQPATLREAAPEPAICRGVPQVSIEMSDAAGACHVAASAAAGVSPAAEVLAAEEALAVAVMAAAAVAAVVAEGDNRK